MGGERHISGGKRALAPLFTVPGWFHLVVTDGPEPFVDAVTRELGFLLTDHDFALVSQSEYIVELESPSLLAQAVWDPRGEVVVNVRRRGVERFGDPRYGQWSYVGMVGRASVSRLLQLAREQLLEEPAVLRGDPEFFDRLAEVQHQRAVEWTAYYARKGPRPSHGPLP